MPPALYPVKSTVPVPAVFPSPFDNRPHPLAIEAAADLQRRLPSLTCGQHDFQAPDGGKMLGVLVTARADGTIEYLAGFSGMLAGTWSMTGFVPPVFNEDEFLPLLDAGEKALADIEAETLQLLKSDAYVRAASEKQKVYCSCETAALTLKEQHQARRKIRHSMRAAQSDDALLLQSLAEQSRHDKQQRQQLNKQWQQKMQATDAALKPLVEAIDLLRRKRKTYSAQLQQRLFDCYQIPSVGYGAVALRSLFEGKLPPGGAGDCAAVKLLAAAIRQNLTPVCLSEFWWGSDNGLRQHGRFYPACRSKCRAILPFMLRGLQVSLPHHEVSIDFPSNQPEIVFEDDSIVVVCKPVAMLSVPGQSIQDSVETRLRARYPQTDNKTLLLHRLDQATSGLLLAAKNAKCYKLLQQQFQRRSVDKTYVANIASTSLPGQGEITLPLRVDLNDRPRQLVCHQHGKQSLTRYTVISVGTASSLVELKPVTGRTHQLRVHAAHPQGLNAPIVGDELYGAPADRLHLHAQSLSFTHPVHQKRMSFEYPAPFATQPASVVDQ